MVANDGSSLSVLIVYRFVFSTAFTVPFVFFFERKSVQNLTGKVLFQAFLCGLFGGSLQQNLYIKSLALVSATYTITMLNLIPAITYVLAVSLRMEKPNLGTPAGKAKLMGTLSGIGGAMILTLYEGKRLFNLSLHIDLLQNATSTTHHSPAGSHVWGLMLALGTALSFSLWFITQSKMSQNFPWHYSIAALTSIMGAIQSFIYAICTERDWSQWKLDWNLRLLTAASAGILASGVCFVLLAWCVGMKGPLYVSAFNPLMLVLVAFISSFVLNEYITVGSLIGAALIVCGYYMLLWGKSKEARKMDNMNVIASENVYWIPDTPDSIPANASHRVGVGAFVVNNKREVLVVQETSGRFGGTGVWKMPTGAVNEGEDICDAVIREVKEETGVETKAHMVLVAFSSSLNSQDSCSFAGTGIQTCDGSNGGDNLSASSL
ncbi:hypothetical protein KIW84_033700 [Lathyrus oleraceus]|uniref:Nudix hydrolase domain-containing protein n=4 Tax=Pisum sativum TaxID=3888 RepID=A0A9D4Y211_PEA|nr:hypothetical protein KIW84_033700 [Pisum sativum]